MQRKVLFIVGPTASGKTGLAVNIAKLFDGEVVSADSMQIYKGIHIASAAPDSDETCGIPHHLIEFLELDGTFSVADYVYEAKKCIEDIISRGKLPIVVGGTGLYVSALLDNTEFIEQKTDGELRKRLEAEFFTLGKEEMLKRLALFDPESAKRLENGDTRRIIRCFEVYETTGKTVTEQNRLSHGKAADFDFLVLGLNFSDREKLYRRIDERVDKMIANGLVEEAKTTFGSSGSTGAFQAIGHKELYGFFEGKQTLFEAAEQLKRQTRRYAKRQLTWFRRDSRIKWLYADEEADIVSAAAKYVSEFLNLE